LLQDSQGYTEKHCLKKTNQNIKQQQQQQQKIAYIIDSQIMGHA
jgi:hypothetical protein